MATDKNSFILLYFVLEWDDTCDIVSGSLGTSLGA